MSRSLEQLDSHLADRSYVAGYTPSQADVQAFEQLAGKAPSGTAAHALRWYRQIASYTPAERKAWAAGEVTPLTAGAKPTAAPAPSAKPTAAPAPAAKEEDDDVDLFGSGDEEEDAEAARVREERLKAYAEKKSNKPVIIAKSSIVLDVKPWDDETDMAAVEQKVRSISTDGLVWGASKLVPVGYGIKKLQIMCVVEDEKVSIDLLSEQIQDFEDLVQSVDVAAFNKI